MVPTKQRAAIYTESGVAFALADVPKPGPGQILVKVVAAVQNPVGSIPRGGRQNAADGWSFEEAAQLGIAALTGLQMPHQSLGLPSPNEPESESGPRRDILNWGGASSVGQYANFDLVRGLGADEVFDYRDENVVEKIRVATGNALKSAIDAVSEGKMMQRVPAVIGDKGGRLAIPNIPYENTRPDVTASFSLAWNLLKLESKGKWYADLLTKILATTNVKPNALLIQPNGLAGVKDGLQYIAEGKVSGQKITYRIADAPE
ncbi:dehydrogenase [Russula earlei]|uniref:Dehydrogenase n=1 Tax=Russula earlei TaxID=71964 RepID=A0ACC0UGJ2_9AGAM|nr:dehydrogenase [Russula earlei]